MIPMGHSAPNYLHQRWLFYSMIFSFLISVSLSDPRITESGFYCGNPRAATRYVLTFIQGIQSLSNVISKSHFATSHVNSTPPIYALAQCHHDLSQTDCLLCYHASGSKISRCLPSSSGRIYLDGCFLRYDNYSFYQEFVSSYFNTVTCSNKTVSGSGNKNERLEFETSVVHAVSNVTSKAVKNDGFGAVGIGGVYALAQCWDSVGKEGCRQCLEAAAEVAKGCLPKREGRGMNAGCYLRYSTEKFYADQEGSENSHGELTIAKVLVFDDFQG